MSKELDRFYTLTPHQRKALLGNLISSLSVCPDNDLKYRLYVKNGSEPENPIVWEKAIGGSGTLSFGRGDWI